MSVLPANELYAGAGLVQAIPSEVSLEHGMISKDQAANSIEFQSSANCCGEPADMLVHVIEQAGEL